MGALATFLIVLSMALWRKKKWKSLLWAVGGWLLYQLIVLIIFLITIPIGDKLLPPGSEELETYGPILALAVATVATLLTVFVIWLRLKAGFSPSREDTEMTNKLATPVADESMWKCAECGKENRDNRDHCWNCTIGRDGSPPRNPQAFEAATRQATPQPQGEREL
jgi:hypothetical protein